MTSRRALLTTAAILLVVAGACRPVAPPPPPPPPLPNAPIGATANPILVDVAPDPAVLDERIRDAPDPFVLAVDPMHCDSGSGAPTACYYAYTTQLGFILTQALRSSDLVHWELGGYDSDGDTWANSDARDRLAPWANLVGHWAPSVMYRPDSLGPRYVMWYSAVSKAGPTAGYHCLGVAVASSPAGPFVDTSSAPAYCQTTQGGTIDPSLFVDSDGTPYLTYKTEGTASVPTRLWVSQLSGDGLALVAGTERMHLEVSKAPFSWENPIIEGPTLARTPAGLFLFYSAYHWETAYYKIGVARCDAPLGPCRRVYRTPLVDHTRGAMLGPGGQTPFVDANGQWHLAFHAWSAPKIGYGNGGVRTLRMLPMTFPGNNPAVG